MMTMLICIGECEEDCLFYGLNMNCVNLKWHLS